MYGQKQILQCLAVALILAAFNFHRAVIKRNRDIKPRILTKAESLAKLKSQSPTKIDEQSQLVHNDDTNSTGYCIRYPFGWNMNGSHKLDVLCPHICFDNFDTWIQKKCQANCCLKKRVAYNQPGEFPSQKPRIRIDNGASLQNKQCEIVKTITKPNNEKLMSNHLTKELKCEIEATDEFICKNTTSITVDSVKLDINQTNYIMDYNGFLFGIDAPLNPKPVRHSADSRSIHLVFLIISIFVAVLTIRCMYKLFIVDHTEAMVRILELRRTLQHRYDEINEEINRNNVVRNNNNASNNNAASTTNVAECVNQDESTAINANESNESNESKKTK